MCASMEWDQLGNMTVDFDSIRTELWGKKGFYQNTHKKNKNHTQSLISGENTTSY